MLELGPVARIELLREDDPSTAPETCDLLHEIADRRGLAEPMNLHRALANSPVLLRTFSEFALSARDPDALTPAQCELAYLSASIVNSCYY